jgi:hypothetical protein
MANGKWLSGSAGRAKEFTGWTGRTGSTGWRVAGGKWQSRELLHASVLLAALGLLLLGTGCETVFGRKGKVPVVAKWGRFEREFESNIDYSNALQDVRLTVWFTSPLGTTCQVDGFWDGGKIWRVRFSPDQPGRWTFKTVCSDAPNQGLHNRAGEFLCTSATGQTRFQRHGPVRVARDHRHFEHADGTPFFWLADTVWNGARFSGPKDWEVYALTRALQKFSVAQWAAAPGVDENQQSAFCGTERIVINPEFFERLDAKLATASRAELLSAVVPLLELGAAADPAARLPEDQAILLVRYVVARWGAEPVVWLLAFEGGNQGRNVGRWKRIGQAVFGEGSHAPVVLYPGETEWVLDEFRDQTWIDAFGYQSVTGFSDDALKWAFTGPLVAEWKKEPTRPLIPFAPHENAVNPRSQKRFSTDDVRQAVYWSLLMTPPAGVSYGAQGVANWDTTVDLTKAESNVSELPAWRQALSLPAAKQMTHLAKFVESIEFWKLRPQPRIAAAQPGDASPRRFITAAGTETKALSLAYVPEDRTVEISIKALPPSPLISWFNPREGEKNPAVAVVSETTCRFPTPNPGDWLLVMKAGKR